MQSLLTFLNFGSFPGSGQFFQTFFLHHRWFAVLQKGKSVQKTIYKSHATKALVKI